MITGSGMGAAVAEGVKVVEVHSDAGIASVQWIAPTVGIVRYHGEGGGFGSPFSFSLTMVKDGEVGLFYAAQDTFTRRTRKAICAAMSAIGVRRIRYERRGHSLRDPVRHKTYTR